MPELPPRLLVLVALAAGVSGALPAGCASPAPSADRAAGPLHGEPGIIAVRNDSGAPILWVRLEATGGTGARRVGEVAPLPIRAQQELTRGAGAARLPDEWTVTWRDASGQDRTATLSLLRIKAAGDYSPSDRLVIRFGPRGAVEVYVEAAPNLA